MISNSGLNYPDNADDSGVRNKVSEDNVLEKKENFQRLVLDLEMDEKYGPLFKLGSLNNKNYKGGILRSTIDDLQKFEEAYLGGDYAANSDDKDGVLRKINANVGKEDALENFRKIFVRSMDKIVANWPTLSASHYQWQEIAGFMSGHFLGMARLMGFEKIYQGHMDNWFIRYAKAEKDYSNRDKLNSEALNVEQELAYYQTTGAEKSVIAATRAKLENINKQLEELPVDPNAAPAFSSLNPNNKANINSRFLKKNGRTIGQESVQEEKPMVEKPSGLRGFLKKIPLLGRLF